MCLHLRSLAKRGQGAVRFCKMREALQMGMLHELMESSLYLLNTTSDEKGKLCFGS